MNRLSAQGRANARRGVMAVVRTSPDGAGAPLSASQRGDGSEKRESGAESTEANVEGEILTLHLPYPPAALQPNQRLGRHFGGMVKHKNQAKGDAHLALCEATECNPPHWQAVGARATFTFRDRRAVLDDDSLTGWLKATRDQIAHDFGMNDRHWFWEKPVVVVSRTAQLGVVVEIWPVEGEM